MLRGRVRGVLVAGVAAAVLAGVGVPVGLGSAAVAAPRTAPADGTGAAKAGTGKPTALTEDAAVSKAVSTGQDVEITSLRAESSETYATADGRLETVQHLRPVRARVDGGWKDVDNTLAAGAGGRVAPKVSTVGMTFSGGGSGPLVSLETAGKELSYTWPTALPAPQLDGDTATYKDVLPDVDLQMRSDTDGFHQLLVVNTATAAQNPALAQLKLAVSGSGLKLAESPDGGLQARDEAGGGLAFEAPTPVMWDSGADGTTESATTAKTRSAQAQTEAAAADGQGPGDASKIAPIGVDVSSDGSQLQLTPDQEMLSAADTRFPVYLDPETYTPKASSWTMASRYWASTPQWRFNGDADAGVGYCGWDYCAPYDLKRLFYQFPASTFAGKTILSATFVAHETHSASCDARPVELWRTKAISSSTTWNSQNNDAFWLNKLSTANVAHGGGTSCPAGDVEFDAKSAVQVAANVGSSTATFGLRASDEDDKYGWKRFSDDAYLRVKYNRPPGQIPMAHLSMNPGGLCKKPADKVSVRIRPSVSAVDVTDPDKDQVSVQFQAYWDAGDGKGMVAHWTSAKIGPKASGSDFSTTLPTSVPEGKTVAWAARSVDYDQGAYYSYSPWSQTGSATACYFVYDSHVPASPQLASDEYPAVDDTDPDDPSYDGVGRYGTFTITSGDSSVTGYEYGINADPSSGNTVTTTAGAAKTIRFRPTRSGTNFITALTMTASGVRSAPATYEFKVKAGQPARAEWNLDDAEGSAAAAGTAGERTLDIHGDPVLGDPGAVGSAVTFDGTDDYLQSDLPTVDTSLGFSVAAWVKLSAMPSAAAVVATQPGNNSPGFELYYSKALDRWAFNQYTADTATATPVRAMQASAGGVQAGQWVHLAGTYSAAAGQLSLYVNGTLAGTAAYTNAWDARRGLQIGAGLYEGVPASYFPGSIDDVRIYDKPLVAADVTRLYNKQPIGTGRPARAVFPLDEPATDDAGNPTTQLSGRADVEDATLKNGAELGQPGVDHHALTLDGVDDYATTTSPHVNNQASFSVVAWAKLSEKPNHAAIIATQTGTNRPGFELYYSATYGWTFNQYVSDSDDSTAVRATQGNTTQSPAGVWTQLIGSYDAVADQLQLFVNGSLVQTTAFAAPFYGGGPVQIGAGSYDGAPDSFFPGQIDQVQLYDRALSAPEASDLYQARPLVEGRWRLDTSTGTTPAVSPDDIAATTDQHPMILGPGAAIDTTGNSNLVGTGGLSLTGDGSYAATATSPIRTDTSFTASAWVTTPGRPTRPMTVMSQAGTNTSSFAVRYVPDPDDPDNAGAWQLDLVGTDSATAAHTLADNTTFEGNGGWDNITVVYDAFATQMRLYVDGDLRETLCADDDDDGTPDDATCTEKVSWNSDAHAFDATGGLQLGRSRTAAGTFGEYLSGAIDDVWVFQGAADDDQVHQLASGADLATNPGP